MDSPALTGHVVLVHLSMLSLGCLSVCQTCFHDAVTLLLHWNWRAGVWCRLLRRLATLLSQQASLMASNEAFKKQAEGASAAAKRYMEDNELLQEVRVTIIITPRTHQSTNTHPDGAWWVICQIVPARNHLQASLSCSFLLLHMSGKYNGAN